MNIYRNIQYHIAESLFQICFMSYVLPCQSDEWFPGSQAQQEPGDHHEAGGPGPLSAMAVGMTYKKTTVEAIEEISCIYLYIYIQD